MILHRADNLLNKLSVADRGVAYLAGTNSSVDRG